MSDTPRRQLILAVVLVPLIVAAALAAFAWPTAHLAPHDLPLGLAGPAPARAQLAQRLQAAHPGAFALHQYADAGRARAAIKNRDIYGAIVAGTPSTALLVASAAGPLVAQVFTQAMTAEAAAAHRPLQVIDVVPAPLNDPRGAALGASVLPLVLAGMLAGILIATLSRPGLAQVAALVAAASLSGIVAAAIAGGWLGVLAGNGAANAGALALTILAIAGAVAGLNALLGRAGLVLGGLLMLLVGNPFSGLTSAPELLPTPVGAIGQLLPPGAGGNLLRSTAFFDGSGAGSHLFVLGAWALLGLAAIASAAAFHRRSEQRLGSHPALATGAPPRAS